MKNPNQLSGQPNTCNLYTGCGCAKMFLPSCSLKRFFLLGQMETSTLQRGHLWSHKILFHWKHTKQLTSTAWVKWKVKVTQLCPTLCNPMDYTVHGILQARILEWVAFPFPMGSSQPKDQTQVSHIASRFLTSWAAREALLLWYTTSLGIGDYSLLNIVPKLINIFFFFFCIWPFLPLSFLVFPSPLCLDCQAYQNLFSEQTHILSVMVYFFPSKKCFSPTVLLSMPSHIRGAVGRSSVQPPGPS